MNTNNQQEAIRMAIAILESTLEDDIAENHIKPTANAPVEMLTIRECAEKFPGLSEHTVRKLVKQDKVRYIRAGEGKRGKILIPKSSLLEYLKGTSKNLKFY